MTNTKQREEQLRRIFREEHMKVMGISDKIQWKLILTFFIIFFLIPIASILGTIFTSWIGIKP